MEDWRTQPRIGRSQFVPLIPEIKKCIEKGYTIKQIYDQFLKEKKITLSYVQFTKYVRAHIKDKSQNPIKKTQIQKVKIKENPFDEINNKKTTRREKDYDIYNPVPDKKRIYGDDE